MPDGAPDAPQACRQINLLIRCPQPVSMKTADSRHAHVIKVLKMLNRVTP